MIVMKLCQKCNKPVELSEDKIFLHSDYMWKCTNCNKYYKYLPEININYLAVRQCV